MIMKINKDELLNILMLLKPGLANKAIVEETTHFIFTGDDIVTYNDSIAISHLFPCDFKFTIMADEFIKILNVVKTEQCEMLLKDSNLIIKEKDMKAKLITGSIDAIKDYLDLIDFGKKRKWNKLPKDFLDAVKLSIFSASKGNSLPIFSYLNIYDNKIIACDEIRISIYEMESKIKMPFLLSASSATYLLNFEVVEYCVENNWVYFITKDDTIFCSRVLNEEYPDMLKNFDFKNKIIELPKEIIDSVSAAEILADGEFDVDKKIEIKIENGKLFCKGSREIGEIEVECNIDSKYKLEFIINPIFFKEILVKTNKMKIGEGKVLFEIKNFKHLISINFS